MPKGFEEEGVRVTYPCLPGHPDYSLARRMLRGCGSLLLIDLGCKGRAYRFLESLRLVKPSTSFGGSESQAVHVASGPASGLDRRLAEAVGLDEGLVRIHVGLEDPEDIVNDLLNALRRAGTC